MLPGGDAGAGDGFTAQLWAGPEGGPLEPLSPTATFRTSSEFAKGYVNSVQLVVPGVAAGEYADLELRAFDGSAWTESRVRGKSKTITIVLGGGHSPPAALVGMQPFAMSYDRDVDVINDEPKLNGSLSGTDLVLSWPATATEFVIEATDRLTTPAWTLVSLTPVAMGEAFSVRIPISGGNRYSRLRKQ